MCVCACVYKSLMHTSPSPTTDNRVQWLTVTEVEADEEDPSSSGSGADPTHAVAWVHIEFSVEEMRRMAVLTTLFLEKVCLSVCVWIDGSSGDRGCRRFVWRFDRSP